VPKRPQIDPKLRRYLQDQIAEE